MPTSEIIKLKNVRLSFPRLFKPRAFREGQEPRFEGTFILDPSDEKHQAIIDEIEATGEEILKEVWPKSIPKSVVRCYGLSDDQNPPLEYDGYPGMYFVRTSANLKNPPGIFDRGRNELTLDANGVEPKIPYAGCYVHATITLWVMNNEFGKRVNANMRLVQFVRDGDAFGAAPPNAEEELDILDDDDDDNFLDD